MLNVRDDIKLSSGGLASIQITTVPTPIPPMVLLVWNIPMSGGAAALSLDRLGTPGEGRECCHADLTRNQL